MNNKKTATNNGQKKQWSIKHWAINNILWAMNNKHGTMNN